MDWKFANRSLRRVLFSALFVAGNVLPFSGASALTMKMLVDNEKFTIQRATFAVGEHQAKLHPPPGFGQIVTLVTPAEMEVNLEEDGKASTEKGHMEPGKTWWLSKTTLHQYSNIGEATFDLIVVTLK